MLKALIVDDSRTMRLATRVMMERLGLEVLEAEDGPSAIERFRRERPDLVLIDVRMPGMDGYEVVRELRTLCGADWVPILFVSAIEQEHGVEQAIEAGGDDFLTKPVSPVVLEAKIRALQRLDGMRRELVAVSERLREANEQLDRLSHQDGLTGLGNRRLVDLLLLREISAARRDARPIGLLLADIDHFKAYNDRYGHLAGDECLRRIAGVLAHCCKRTTDVAARYGGEEFALILPDTDAAGARAVASAVVRELRALAIEHAASPTAPVVTVSLGVTCVVPEANTTSASLLAGADEALYQAKGAGRNRVAVRGALGEIVFDLVG